MKKTLVMLAMLGLVGFAGQGWAASSDSITVTVSLTEEVSVSLDYEVWNIGPIALGGGPYASPAITATNDGNVAIDLTIAGTDGNGGWSLAASATDDAFAVDVNTGAVALSTGGDSLASNLAKDGTQGIAMSYSPPTTDSYGGGVDQGFTVTVSATQYVP